MNQTDQTRYTWTEVDLDQLRRNLDAIIARVGGPSRVMPVVKAGAYGHGALECSRVALEAGCTRLAVAILDEAIALRNSGITCDLHVLGHTPPGHLARAVAGGITVTLFDVETARALDRAAREHGTRARAHLKVDTGMSRIGARPGPEIEALGRLLQGLDGVEVEGVFTHFACADSDHEFTCAQLTAFQEALEILESVGVVPPVRHAANSAGILDFPQAHLDLVRPGLILYGYYPSATVSRETVVRPALTWYSRPAMVKTIPAGTSVGYGRTFTARSATRVATLPVGYADGYPRALSNCGHVLFGHRPAPILGRVCMDQIMVDVSELPGVTVDSIATLLGPGLDADDLANAVGTIAHEILTGISPRVPRIYQTGG
ncbi:MAG: alanine racemase [Bacillota bacterium]